ncbi:hypothetical protein HUA74_19260 [Myxococcus sp. CA051A]|uniref:DUF2220 domain-containing protein n=1 Tax=unclassified Myxococcus TaxID=2648731 RepID=UPI00157ADACA|nr:MULTISPECIES: DUF2220 domain-containing protein [unclassified Myxococcus]NTX16466.1 hypothetical protein [Myxococcus sp. CA056]NTX50387.1 hypothetical protein [Myxococcus sp. CA039A]NTX62788.1 hypothetical protein [Myxococcus sp. CA051A]
MSRVLAWTTPANVREQVRRVWDSGRILSAPLSGEALFPLTLRLRRPEGVYYWGDIDTHGFAILDRLRAHHPRVHSLLMDRDVLLAHNAHWVEEDKPHRGTLSRLTESEAALYEDLRHQRLGERVRLEQEHIGFRWVENTLARLSA